jgi:hypothetical protein
MIDDDISRSAAIREPPARNRRSRFPGLRRELISRLVQVDLLPTEGHRPPMELLEFNRLASLNLKMPSRRPRDRNAIA